MKADPLRSSTIRGWRRWTLVVLLALVSVNALAAGYGFMARPDGSALGIPVAWLADSPFADYRVPGAILFSLGILYGFAAFREGRASRDAWFWAGVSGGAMVVWIAVQVSMMGYDRHPLQTTLQAIVLAIGVVTAAIAFTQRRDARARQEARA